MRREMDSQAPQGDSISGSGVEAGGPAIHEELQRERERLLGSLHDTVLQSLEYIAAGGYGGAPDVEALRAVAARAADDLRCCLEGLHEDGSDSCGLVDGLREIVTEARAFNCFALELVEGPNDGSVEGADAAALTLAVREALTNARKHAQADRVVVYCESGDGEALVTVRDDGVGMERARIGGGSGTRRGGLGVRHSIIRRLADRSGQATFESSPGQGTLVTLRLGQGDWVEEAGESRVGEARQ